MTIFELKKAIESTVENYEYASEILKCVHAQTHDGDEITAAIIAIREDKKAVTRWRLYYSYDSMNNLVNYMNYFDCKSAELALNNMTKETKTLTIMTPENLTSKHSVELTGNELYLIHTALFNYVCDTERKGMHNISREAEQLRRSISGVINSLK